MPSVCALLCLVFFCLAASGAQVPPSAKSKSKCESNLEQLTVPVDAYHGFFERKRETLVDKDWETVEAQLREVYGAHQLGRMGPVGDDVIQGALMELVSEWNFYRLEVFGGHSETSVLRHVLNHAARENRQEVGDLMPAWAIEDGKTNEGSFVEDYRKPEGDSYEWREWVSELPPDQQDFVTAFQEGHQTPREMARVLGLESWRDAVSLGKSLADRLSADGVQRQQAIPITEGEAAQLEKSLEGGTSSHLGVWFYDQIRLRFGMPHLGTKDVVLLRGENGSLQVRLPEGPDSFSARTLTFKPVTEAVETIGLSRFMEGLGKSSLTPEQRVLVSYRYWKGLSVKEIARRIDKPWRQVAEQLYSATAELKGIFGNRMHFDSFRVALDAGANLQQHNTELDVLANQVAARPVELAGVGRADDARAVWLSRYQLQILWDWKVEQGNLAHIAHRMEKTTEALRSAIYTGFLPKISKFFGQDRLSFDSITFVKDPNSPNNPMALVRRGGRWVAVPIRSRSGEPLQSERAEYVVSRENFYRLVHSLPRPYRATALLLFEDRLPDHQVMRELGIAPNVIEMVKFQVTNRLRHRSNDGRVDAANFAISESVENGQVRLDWDLKESSVLRVTPEDLGKALSLLTPDMADYARSRLNGWSHLEIAEARGVTEHSAATQSSVAMRQLGEKLGWQDQVGTLFPRDILVLRGPESEGRKRAGDIRTKESPVGNSLPQQVRYYLSQRTSGGDARVSMVGLARMAQDLGVQDMRTMYHAAVIAVGAETAAVRRWAPFPGTPELALKVRRALQSKTKTKGYEGRDGFQRFSDRFFGGDLPRAWDGAMAVMGQVRFEGELGWGERPTPKWEGAIRLAEVEQREPNALGARLGQLRASFETGDAQLSRVYRAGKREGLEPALKEWASFDGTPGEYLLLTEELFIGDNPHPDFVGPLGLRRFADQYFAGQANRVNELGSLVLSDTRLASLGWTKKVSASPSEKRPYYGNRILPDGEGALPEPEFSPAQRAAAAGYLHAYAQHGRPPSQNEIGTAAMTRLTDLFGSLPQAHLQIKAYAQQFGLNIRMVEAVIETPPGPELKAEWQRESVDLYLEWMLRNEGRIPTQPDWGRRQPGQDRVGVDQARMFGSDVYGTGKPQAEYQVFSSQQEALLRVSERAHELGIPFSLLGQKFRSSDTPSELRKAWQAEARGLLEKWRDANPGKTPKALDWGAGEGKVGMTYKRFFLQARNPKEWIFEGRAEADQMMKEIFP